MKGVLAIGLILALLLGAQINAKEGNAMTFPIACYPWDESGYKPEAYAELTLQEDGLHVKMRAREATIRSEVTEIGGAVCVDSCLEFFFQPFPQTDDRYLNIECNPNAVMHIGLGTGREGRTVWKSIPEGFAPAHAREGDWWEISYTVPSAFIAELFGQTLKSGDTIRANFYKCDESIHPHFGCWNPVVAAKPDFHRPECFGEITLQ